MERHEGLGYQVFILDVRIHIPGTVDQGMEISQNISSIKAAQIVCLKHKSCVNKIQETPCQYLFSKYRYRILKSQFLSKSTILDNFGHIILQKSPGSTKSTLEA